MGTSVAVPPPMLPGLANDLDIARLVASFQIEEVGHHVTLDRMPTKDERELFQIRFNNLTKKLRRCDLATADLQMARKNLGAMFMGFPSLRNTDTDDLLNAYLLVLQSYPLFAIVEACLDVVHNRFVGADPNWPPTSPLMAKRAADHVARVATEQLKIEKLLRADRVMRPPAADGAHERVMASLQDFHGKLAGGRLLGALTAEERRAAALRQQERDRQTVLADWKGLGIAPIYTREGQPMTVALARQNGLIEGI